MHVLVSGVPVALSGRPFVATAPDPDPPPYVAADNVGGAMAAARLLAGQGRRRIVTITGRADMTVTIDRRDGFRAGLAPHDLTEAATRGGDFTIDGGRVAMTELLADVPDLDAVFAANDLMAAGALQVLADAGRSVPGDVAVIGFDDSPLAGSTQPALTTVSQPMVEMGRALVEQVLRIIDGQRPNPVIMPTTLVRRASA